MNRLRTFVFIKIHGYQSRNIQKHEYNCSLTVLTINNQQNMYVSLGLLDNRLRTIEKNIYVPEYRNSSTNNRKLCCTKSTILHENSLKTQA